MLYILFAILALGAAIFLYLNPISLGYYYLSIGMFIFFIYTLGKGIVMLYFYYSRYQFYKGAEILNTSILQEEKDYVVHRANKKVKNRRRYLYLIGIFSIIAFAGIFSIEKGLIVATCIPIVLISAIEFSIGLMTTFRLNILANDITKVIE